VAVARDRDPITIAGTVKQSAKYYPFGGVRSGSITVTDKRFTGQQEEGTAFGLYDYGARPSTH
jgi:hypothetical protein